MNHTVTHCCSFGDGRDGVALKMNIKPSALRAEDEGDQILLPYIVIVARMSLPSRQLHLLDHNFSTILHMKPLASWTG